MRAYVVSIILVASIVFRAQADDLLSEETRRFMGLNFEERVQEAASISSDERIRRIEELKEATVRNRAGKESYVEARAFLADEEALKQLVGEFIGNDGASPGLLAPMRNPRIIEMVAPEFFRNEPMQLTGGDVVFIPRSFRAAELAVELMANSPAFNPEVINWARTVSRLKWSEQRELVRPWWKANEQFFREKNYKAVQPGPEPPRDPFATERPEAPREAAVAASATASPAPATPIPQAAAVAVEREAPRWPWLVGILALIAIVAVALKRRA